jgi:hypothetical protein
MNPETNRFESLTMKPEEFGTFKKKLGDIESRLLRPNGEPVPAHWTQFHLDELVVIKGYTFKVKYIGESVILFEPVGPVIVGVAAKEGK